jgi:arylsulfatase A-like enzyme
MRDKEITLAEALKTQGYTTGHFGKWHLGTLTTAIEDSNRGGPKNKQHFSPPWQNGFDVCFSTEARVPTWNPMKKPGTDEPFGTRYWRENGAADTDNLDGDDSRVIMDRAVPFIRKAVADRKPFFAVVWFHTPHRPVVAGADYRAMYAGRPEQEQHYFGCITAMDEQLGRLRRELRALGVAGDTMLWFCSDNGPEGRAGKAPGTAGPLRGRKRDLFEGGVRVPGLLEWPARIKQPRVVAMPCSTSDYFPTVLDALGFQMQGQPEPIDGVSLLPLIDGEMTSRPRPIGFESRNQVALIDNRWKLISQDGGTTYMLFDLVADPGEARDLAAANPDVVRSMQETVESWRASCRRSRDGKDDGKDEG